MCFASKAHSLRHMTSFKGSPRSSFLRSSLRSIVRMGSSDRTGPASGFGIGSPSLSRSFGDSTLPPARLLPNSERDDVLAALIEAELASEGLVPFDHVGLEGLTAGVVEVRGERFR